MSKKQEYIIAVEGSMAFNMQTQMQDYTMKILVSEDVYRWLEAHDIEYTESRERVFLYNNLRYLDLGPAMDSNISNAVPMSKGGEA